jgi:ribose transport system substrate-binding protein
MLGTGAVAGCGQQPSASGQTQVAYLATSMTASYSIAIAAGYRSGVAEVPGVRQTVVAPLADADPVKQLTMFRDLMKTAQGGIAYTSAEPGQFVDVLTDAGKQGIPLIAVDVPPSIGSGVTLYVGNDNQDLGRMLADLVIDQLPPDASGTVILGNPRPGLPVLDLRAQAARDEFGKRLPGVQVEGPYDTSSRQATGMQAWRHLARANPKALAMLSVGADGPILAKVRQSTKARWKAGAFDLDPLSLAAVKRGDLLLVSPEHFLKGAIAGRLEAEAATGQRSLPKGWISTPGLSVMPANVDSIIERESSDAARLAWFKPALAKDFANGGPHVFPLSQAR